MRIEGNAPDPWSVLRRTYTGPKFFVLLAMFAAAIILPYAVKYFYLTMESEVIFHTNSLVQSEEFQQHLTNSQDIKQFSETFGVLKKKHDNSTKVPAILVMLGVQKNVTSSVIQVLLSVVIIFYNAARAFLTIKISTLRDAEERSKITPSKDEYLGFYVVHRWVSVIMYVSIGYAAYRGLWWCCTTWVPLT